jgi:hypothetical protein
MFLLGLKVYFWPLIFISYQLAVVSVHYKMGQYWICSQSTPEICCTVYTFQQEIKWQKKFLYGQVTASALVSTLWVILSVHLVFFFFVPPGHIIQYFPVQALYPEPYTRPYGIRIYRHSSSLRALTAGRFRPTRPATVVGKACFITI